MIHLAQGGLTESIDVLEGVVLFFTPGQFALGTTLERIVGSDDILGKLEGKSTLGRLGLQIHQLQVMLIQVDGETHIGAF